ncbi:MAG: hypothetical protein WBL95_15590 [Microcoleus sp.]
MFGSGFCSGFSGCLAADFVADLADVTDGSSAADFVADLTDVTDVTD